jgi:hypothetical protein
MITKIDINKNAQIIDIEKKISELSESGEFICRLASGIDGEIGSDLWASILLGTICENPNRSLSVRGWGISDWGKAEKFIHSLPAITAFRLTNAVYDDRGISRFNSSSFFRSLAYDRDGILEQYGGTTRTLVEFGPALARALRPPSDREVLFANLVKNFRKHVEVENLKYGIPVDNIGAVGKIADFLHELHDNSLRYGNKLISFNESKYQSLRVMRFRRHIFNSANQLLGKSSIKSPLHQYLKPLCERRSVKAVIEVVVSDFGEGIVDHFLNSPRGRNYISVERGELLHSLLYQKLSSRNHPEAGDGLSNALSAAKSMSAFLSLRTSEFWWTAAYSDHNQDETLSPFRSADKVAGTHWQIVWPMGL